MILRGRIRTQLYLLLMAVAVPLTVVVGVAIVDDMRHDEEQAGETARLLALSVADEAQEALADTRDHLGRLARLLLSVPPGEAGCDSALDPFLKLSRRFIAAFVLDGLGRPVCIRFAADVEDGIGGGRPAGSDLSWLEAVPPGSRGPVVVRAADGARVIQIYPIGVPGGGREALVMGSYQDFAVMERDRFIAVRKTGVEVLDPTWRPLQSADSWSEVMAQAVEQNSRSSTRGAGGG